MLSINPNNFFFNFNNSLLEIEYLPILILVIFSIVLSSIILALSYFLSVQNPETEKLSSYECGFEPYEDARHKFNINFYIIAILFIVFDIEAMYLFSWSVSLSNLDIIGFWSMVDFIIELSVGFVYVLYVGALDWE
jgi:NADH-quinone oxidoreductase subunit A